MHRPAVLALVAIAAGLFACLWRPSAQWVESAYANGFYPVWERAIYHLTSRLPWSLGDIVVVCGVAALLWCLWSRQWLWALAVVGIYAFWFEAGWGWNYNRAPLETRVVYVAQHENEGALRALRARAIAEMNRLAALAHARADVPLDTDALYAVWLPVVQAGGDAWTPLTYPPKPTLADPFMNATGTSGYINPLTLNSHLASDLLWFERPFALAHEWSHVAAYAREDEANYIAIVTTTRSSDPAIAYSGWLSMFLYLPPLEHYEKSTFSPLVWQDFAAIAARNRRHLNVSLATFSWRTYNTYLKSNHIASGIENYNEVTRLYLGIQLDRQGVPIPRP
jgi:Protein of unknown function (DUF3810)